MTRNNAAFVAPVVDRVITDTATVRQLDDLILALPENPPGVRFCPLDASATWRLVFSGQGRTLLQVVADPQGCQVVWLTPGPDRWTAQSPGFWPAFARLLDLPLRQVTMPLCGPTPIDCYPQRAP